MSEIQDRVAAIGSAVEVLNRLSNHLWGAGLGKPAEEIRNCAAIIEQNALAIIGECAKLRRRSKEDEKATV